MLTLAVHGHPIGHRDIVVGAQPLLPLDTALRGGLTHRAVPALDQTMLELGTILKDVVHRETA